MGLSKAEWVVIAVVLAMFMAFGHSRHQESASWHEYEPMYQGDK